MTIIAPATVPGATGTISVPDLRDCSRPASDSDYSQPARADRAEWLADRAFAAGSDITAFQFKTRFKFRVSGKLTRKLWR